MTVYRLLTMPNNLECGTYSNLLKVWRVINNVATDLKSDFISYGRFAGLMKGCESNLFHIKGQTDFVYKLERIKVQ